MEEETETEAEISMDGIEVATPEDLIDEVQLGAKVYSELTATFMETFQFYELTLKEWAEQMTVDIPDRLNETEYRTTLIRLGNRMNAAHNYHSLASSLAKAFSGGAQIKKSDVIAAIVHRFESKRTKRPAATVVEQMADSYMKSSVSSAIAAEIVKDFWKQRIDLFDKQAKLLEQIGISLHCQDKYGS